MATVGIEDSRRDQPVAVGLLRGLGAALGPLIVLSLTWDKMTGSGAVAGLVTGAAVVIAWIAMGWNGSFLGGEGVYEIIPGFFAAWLAIILVSKATTQREV